MSVLPGELAGLPDGGPAELDVVKKYLGIPADDDQDDAELTDVIDAVNDLVRGLPVAQLAITPEGGDPVEWPYRIVRGATMLAARLFRRRDTVAGVYTFGDEGAVYVARNDPDVAILLDLGSYSKPAVG